MSPSKFQDTEVSKGVMINCNSRHSPLRINRDSHAIHKPSSSHQPVVENAGNSNVPAQKNHTKRQPVIIYTHSPKVIHAQASDFMALVQKLTGYSRSTEEEEEEEGRSSVKPDIAVKDEGNDSRLKNDVGYEDHETSSSVLTDERYVSEFKPEASIVSPPLYNHMPNPYIVEVPFFTPNSNESYMCSSRAGAVFHSSGMANPISPSFMDYMKGFPEI
ncbi:hypothetical protein F511_20586 [Dorcoceras hygrometricum]|uniref:VQ domain-containing protein n=1 Tax=Dorcoceras hygrometricum TaxID=472368 RepID=A0A2Z7CTF4_9LAMI|nr:hypothetical protein F511_20586 [Dorcoceras hygrometricum]